MYACTFIRHTFAPTGRGKYCCIATPLCFTELVSMQKIYVEGQRTHSLLSLASPDYLNDRAWLELQIVTGSVKNITRQVHRLMREQDELQYM